MLLRRFRNEHGEWVTNPFPLAGITLLAELLIVLFHPSAKLRARELAIANGEGSFDGSHDLASSKENTSTEREESRREDDPHSDEKHL